jgi:lamin tail-like protein
MRGSLWVVCVLITSVGRAWGGVALNEIVVRPAAGEGEWIELAASDSLDVSLNGWTIRDATGKTRRCDGVLPAHGFLILAARPDSLRLHYGLPDSILVVHPDGWPILNDHDAGPGLPADVIVLADANGVTQDSVAYFEDWLPPESGRSIERVDTRMPAVIPGAWGWSVAPNGATPGRANSLSAIAGAAEDLFRGPTEAAPRTRPAVFTYRLPGSGRIDIRLIDETGREVALLKEQGPSPPVGSWTWGGGSPLPERPGLYFVCLRWQAGKERIRRCRPVWVTP